MIMQKINKVPQNMLRFGLFGRVNAWYKALVLEGLVIKKWTRQIKHPSNSTPYSDERVTGLNICQNITYDVFATINNEIPDPKP